MSNKVLWCIVGGKDAGPFKVRISSNDNDNFDIDDLRKRINEEPFFRAVAGDLYPLVLWKPKEKIPLDLEENLIEHFRGPNFSQVAEKLSSNKRINKAFPDQDEDDEDHQCLGVIVQVSTLSDPGSQKELVQDTQTPPSRTELTIQLLDLGHWGSLCDDDLLYSEVKASQAGSSQFLQQFQQRLRRQRYVVSLTDDVYPLLQRYVALDSYFKSFDPLQETNISELDKVTETELVHYHTVLRSPQLKEKNNYKEDKESQVRSFLMELLNVRSRPEVTCAFRKQLPFHLVVECGDQKRYTYTPRSDFRLCIKNFPHILMEVNSEPNETDRFRMLLQAACMARLGNKLRSTSGEDEPIPIMAIYVDEEFMAQQYILCQPNASTMVVEYVHKTFDLKVSKDAFEFIFQTYNFCSLAQDDNARLNEPRRQLAQAKISVSKKKNPSLTSGKRGFETAQERANKKPKPNPDTPAQGGQEDGLGSPSVQREITRAGYTPTGPIPEGFQLLPPLKSTMCQATSRDGVLVVLKTVVHSNELQVLEYLNRIKEPSSHTIPLLDVIELSIGKTIIVLPWKISLEQALDYEFRDCPPEVVSLCLQFIEGVAFLHRHMVAHCDLKPGNVVVDTKSESPRLFIIDFDLAQLVDSAETVTEGWCGTPQWTAPELGSMNGPIRSYSPILADRWACGQVVQYFARHLPEDGAPRARLLADAKRLLDDNPRERPELNQLHAELQAKLNALQAIRGPRKRRAAPGDQAQVRKRKKAQSS